MNARASASLALAVLLGACAGTSAPAGEPPSAGESTAAQAESTAAQAGAGLETAHPVAVVEMTQAIRFAPDTLRIRTGDVVEWRNVSTAIGHTATLEPEAALDSAHASLPRGARGFDSGNVPPGGAWRHRFTVPGTYVYYCTPHESVGMVGVILVAG